MSKKNKRKDKETSCQGKDEGLLRPCPFCGSDLVVQSMYRQNPFSDYDGTCVAMTCLGCGVHAMYPELDCTTESLREAVRRWNTRDGE